MLEPKIVRVTTVSERREPPTDFVRPIPSRDELRELKVKVPVSIHIGLQTLKILHHRQISNVVAEALRQYFERIQKSPASAA